MGHKFAKGVSFLLSLILIVTSLNLGAPVQAAGDGQTTDNETTKVYEGNGYQATYTLLATWEGGSNFQIEIKNTGDKTIENWSILVEYQDEINNIWNAEIVKKEDNKYAIKNAGWNQDILVGQSICFGMSASSAFTAVPASITLLDNFTAVKTEGIELGYTLSSSWDNGCTGNITVNNQTDKSIEDWTLEFDCESAEVTFWDGILDSREGNHFVVYNAGYNSVIAAGESVSVGFLVNGEVAEELIKNLTLTEKADQPQGQVGIDDGPDQPGDKEPLGDIGENYFKPATAADVVTDEETGIKYVRNQLLISAYLGTPRVAIEEIAEELGAEIVGYTAITCDYQFEFTEDKTLDDLDAIAEYLSEYPYISGVFLNTVVEEICDYNSNDFLYKDGLQCVKKYADGNGDGDTFDDEDYDYIELVTPSVASNQDVWDEVNPGGDNWNLEMLHVPSAWDLVVDSHNVKVGVIDTYFEDVVYPSGKIELEFADIVRNVNFNPKNHKLAHGDHVAGIIAARHNNNYGISGVATNVTLYGYTMRTKDLDASGDVDVNSMAGVNVALNTLICNHVKVINMSLGYEDGTKVYGASQGNTKAIEAIEEDVSIITEHLRKLTDAGYDFLITKSAGNWNDEYFVKDSSTFGYHIYQSGVEDASKKEGGLDSDPTHIAKAMYGHYINAISDPVLRERIVVVGAFGKGMSALAAMSGRGDGLDVAAPGVAILSTVPRSLDISAAGSRAIPGYKIWQGTSMATPHIAGIAALMFQVKPSIPARTVKRFLTADENAVKQIGGVNVPNAEKCVKKAINVLDTPGFDEDWPTGLLAGSVGNASSNKILDATINIQAVRHSTGDYNLDRYAFNFTSDDNGDFLYPLPQGTYDILVYINGNSYLPTVIKDVEINPDETTYLETIRLSTWSSKASGSVKGIVNDAITGSALKGVTVKIRKGWNVTSGGYVTTLLGSAKTDTTSADGKFSISAPIGAYTVELVKSGYVTAYYNVLSTPGNASSVGYDTTMSMTPVLPDDEYRIVLTWGSTPSDLDSHLFYYKNGKQQFHVCYWNKVAYLNGQKVANLDLDDTSSYGPETITITVDADLVENGELRYCVHNYSGGSASALSDSGATVRIYRGNQLEKTYNITRNREGMVWHVFKIDENGIETDYTFDNIIS